VRSTRGERLLGKNGGYGEDCVKIFSPVLIAEEPERWDPFGHRGKIKKRKELKRLRKVMPKGGWKRMDNYWGSGVYLTNHTSRRP